MKPIKVMRCNGSFRYKAQRRKQIQKTALAIFLSLVVIGAAFFTVYVVSRSIAESAEDHKTTVKLEADATAEMTISLGEVCTLTLPEGVDVRDVSFTSTDMKIARVDPSGRVDGLAEGAATITAASEQFTAACKFNVARAQKRSGHTEVTTAYSANLETLSENAEKGTDNLYHLTVNRRTNTVTAYTYDKDGNYTIPVRAMVCSCGSGGANVTPTGEFRVASKRTWALLYGDDSHPYLYGQYVTEFNGEYLFHSVPYEERDKRTLENEEFNKLGTNASQGCVRLMTADSRWIYNNCPMNTPVTVIDADASADPLGTPPAVKQNYNNGWDPTDPNVKNPYVGKEPRILNIEDITVKKGADFDPMDGVIARDICGNRITDRVTITGKVITDKPGVYYLNYNVTDDFHQSHTATRVVTVKQSNS